MAVKERSRDKERVDVKYFTDRAMMVGTSITRMGKYGTRKRRRESSMMVVVVVG